MVTIDYNQLLSLITPALAVSVFAYFVYFFGKVISDQIPFADDRKWHIQISGVMFMLNALTGVLGVYLANTFPLNIDGWLLHFVTVSTLLVVGGILLFHVSTESSKIFKYNERKVSELDNKFDGLITLYSNLGKYIGVGILPILLLYIGTIEFMSGNIYTIIVSFVIIFYTFIWSAFGYSLRKIKDITPVDIYFVDKDREPLIGARVLKFNDDNVRIRVEDTIYIINKNEILMTKMKIPEKSL